MLATASHVYAEGTITGAVGNKTPNIPVVCNARIEAVV